MPIAVCALSVAVLRIVVCALSVSGILLRRLRPYLSGLRICGGLLSALRPLILRAGLRIYGLALYSLRVRGIRLLRLRIAALCVTVLRIAVCALSVSGILLRRLWPYLSGLRICGGLLSNLRPLLRRLHIAEYLLSRRPGIVLLASHTLGRAESSKTRLRISVVVSLVFLGFVENMIIARNTLGTFDKAERTCTEISLFLGVRFCFRFLFSVLLFIHTRKRAGKTVAETVGICIIYVSRGVIVLFFFPHGQSVLVVRQDGFRNVCRTVFVI